MSRGTPIHSLRIPPELAVKLQEWIEQSLNTRAAGPFTLTSLLLKAVEEKLAHRKRSNGPRCKPKKPHGPQHKLLCENCRGEMTLDDCGQFTNDPLGGWLAQCWECLNLHGPFAPGVPSDHKDSGT